MSSHAVSKLFCLLLQLGRYTAPTSSSTMRLVIVFADRLTAFRASFVSGHTSSATVFKNFFKNS